MYRLLAIAKYDERYVIPPAHAEQAHALEELATECSLDYEGGRAWAAPGPFGEGSGGADADRGRELPDAAGPADRRHHRRRPTTRPRRVNLLNWDGKGTPDGLFPPRGTATSDRDARRAAPTPRPRARDAGSSPSPGRSPRCCSTTPTRSSLARVPDCCAARRRRCPTPVGDAARARSSTTSSATPLAELAAATTSRPSTTAGAATCYLTYFAHGDTRKRGMALLRFKQTYRAAGLRARRRRAARPPLRRARVRRHRRPRAGAAAAARPPGRARAAAARRCATPARRGPACVEAVCATLPPLRGDERDAVRRLAAEGPPEEEVGLDAVRHARVQPRARPASAPTALPDADRSRGARSMNDVPVGDRALRLPADVRGRALLALPLRQVRLDHPLLPALREPAAAHRQPAVPLRHARASSAATSSAWSSRESWTEAVGHQRARLPRRRGRRRHRSPASATVVGHGDPDLPPAHRRAGLLRHHARWTRSMYVFLGARHRARHVEHRRRPTVIGGELQLPRGRLGLVPRIFLLPARPRADGATRRSGFQLHALRRVRALRAVAVHPAGARVQRAGRLPHPPLHRLPDTATASSAATGRGVAGTGWARDLSLDAVHRTRGSPPRRHAVAGGTAGRRSGGSATAGPPAPRRRAGSRPGGRPRCAQPPAAIRQLRDGRVGSLRSTPVEDRLRQPGQPGLHPAPPPGTVRAYRHRCHGPRRHGLRAAGGGLGP